MSESNGKVCCNCWHNIRDKDEKYDIIVCRCSIEGRYLSYAEVMTGWCRHWSKDKETENDNRRIETTLR